MTVIKISQRTLFKTLKDLSQFKIPYNVGNGYNNTLTVSYSHTNLMFTLVNSRFQVRTILTNNYQVLTNEYHEKFSYTLPFDSLLSYEQLINSSNQSGILTLEFNDHLLHLAKDNIQIDYNYTNEPQIFDNINSFSNDTPFTTVLGNDFCNALQRIEFVTDKEGSSIGGAIITFNNNITLSGYSGNKIGTTIVPVLNNTINHEPLVINQKDISRLSKFAKTHKDDFIKLSVSLTDNIMSLTVDNTFVTVDLNELNDSHIIPFIDNIPDIISNDEPNIFNYQQLVSQLPALNTKLLIINNHFIEKAGSTSSKPVNLSVDLKLFKKMIDNTVYMNSSRVTFTTNGTNNIAAIYDKNTTYLLTETKQVK